MNAEEHKGHQIAARQRALIKGYLLLSYVLAVHIVDSLATNNVHFLIDWDVFSWHAANGFDLFKFLAWFVVPLVLFFPSLDLSYFTFRRWKSYDYYLLAGLAGMAVLVVSVIPLFPSLRETYPSMSQYSGEAKWLFVRYQLVWLVSWLVGWEFLHRYILLFKMTAWWGRAAWVLVPAVEGLYHVAQHKPLLETVGMVVFSIFLCQWALRRRNVLLPFLAHLIVELTLVAFLVLA